jgi:hypothetical protein
MYRATEEGTHFEMSSSSAKGTLYLEFVTPFRDLRAMYAGAFPLDRHLVARRHRYYEGTRPFDVVWAEIYPLFSSRAIALLHAVGATGWKAVPVRLDGVETPQDYSAVQVLGRGGPMKMLRGHSLVVKDGSDWVTARGACVDDERWDGSDLWGPTGAVVPFVTRKVRDAFAAEKIRGVKFTDFCRVERQLRRADFDA